MCIVTRRVNHYVELVLDEIFGKPIFRMKLFGRRALRTVPQRSHGTAIIHDCNFFLCKISQTHLESNL